MKRFAAIVSFLLLISASAFTGCTTGEQRSAAQYESFLKSSLGDLTDAHPRYAKAPAAD